MTSTVRRALLSVSDKSGLEPFARQLHELGIELVATGGTRKLLAEAGLPVLEVAELTEFPEMMDGRVKTLHPRIHGGILGRREDASHRAAMEEHGIRPIDMVVVNLYPFEATVAREGVDLEEAIENIDIGGPSMLRSAAKNHADVVVLSDPADYEGVVDELKKSGGSVAQPTRRRLAQKTFAHTAAYDAAISGWMHGRFEDVVGAFPRQVSAAGEMKSGLRYGENPHQAAAVYCQTVFSGPSVVTAEFLGGKELSFNNYLDLDAALKLTLEFERPFACVLKHNNPCGAACADSPAEAIAAAWEGDPLSAFGSILGFNRPVDLACAEFLVSGGRFVEAILAPSFDEDALERLRTGAKWGKNVRLLASPELGTKGAALPARELRPLVGGFLAQAVDDRVSTAEDLESKTQRTPSDEERRGMLFAERIAKHVKSNAIVIAKGERVLGVGAGQMSRVDSVRIAVEKSGDEIAGAVLASDAFFPFPDGVELALQAGVSAILQPGGSIRDDQVIAAVDAAGGAMVFTGARHFRH